MTAPELVVFPDVEAWLVGYLAGRLADRDEPYASDVDVSNTEPDPRPARSIVVRRDGGPRLDRFRELARVSLNVWAETDADAADLANLARALIAACPDGKPVVNAGEQSGPVAVPDVQPHRLVVVELTVRGSAL